MTTVLSACGTYSDAVVCCQASKKQLVIDSLREELKTATDPLKKEITQLKKDATKAKNVNKAQMAVNEKVCVSACM